MIEGRVFGTMTGFSDVRSVTEFQRNIKDYVVLVKEAKSPLLLTVNGRAEIVVQDAKSYQSLMERLERAEHLALATSAAAKA